MQIILTEEEYKDLTNRPKAILDSLMKQVEESADVRFRFADARSDYVGTLKGLQKELAARPGFSDAYARKFDTQEKTGADGFMRRTWVNLKDLTDIIARWK